ncbi:sigma-70 family RNA polymerase sigma factor [Brevibacillus ginsengisoli]|uniref:sigma-70 family RNA polymerase sigma factor n=1 Tax=Brevibacillus ginsengisoli TaxID=363854 RepID=UPI003CEDD01C
MEEQLTKELFSMKERAYRIAYSYLHNEQDSLDAVSDALEKALANAQRLERPEYLKTWFVRIVINQCKMMKRKNHRLVVLQEEFTSDEGTDQPLTEEKLDLEEGLMRLSPADRNLIYLRYYMGYTLDEIAQVTQMPIGTVKTKLYRNLRDLRHKLTPVNMAALSIQCMAA